MLSFKINSERVLPYLSKYDLLFYDERVSFTNLADGNCLVSFDISVIKDLSINDKTFKTNDFEEMRILLLNSIKELIIKKSYDEALFNELVFLIFYIGFYKNISPELFSSSDIRTIKLANLRKLILNCGGLHNLKMEFKIDKKSNQSKKSALKVEFDSLDPGYIYLSHFIKPLAKLLNIDISDKDDLLKNQLSEDEIDSIIKKHEQKLRAKQKNIEAKGALILGDFLKNHFDVRSSKSLIHYDQIKIIYVIYYLMGWHSKPKKSTYIERFKKEVERNCSL